MSIIAIIFIIYLYIFIKIEIAKKKGWIFGVVAFMVQERTLLKLHLTTFLINLCHSFQVKMPKC